MSEEKKQYKVDKGGVRGGVRITDKDLTPTPKEKEPAANKLNIRRIAKLFRMFCVHRDKYADKVRFEDVWQGCSDCILSEISWSKGISCERNLCFAIWHEGVLND